MTDYDLLEKAQNITERDLLRLMKKSVGYIEDLVKRTSGIDLTLRDDKTQEFEEDLPGSVTHLIVTGMTYHWFIPFWMNTEHMHDVLSTKDFSLHAPHNTLFRMREVKEELDDTWRRERSWYAQRYGQLRNLVKSGGR